MLEKGTQAGREKIRNTAEEGLSDTSQAGMKRLKYELPKDVLKRAKEKPVVLNVARTELIAKLDNLLLNPILSVETKAALTKARNSLRDHLTQDDLVGALRDKFGKEVRQSGSGNIFDHLKEVNEAQNSLRTATNKLVKELQKTPKGTIEFSNLSNDLDAVNEITRRVKDFLDTK